MRSSRVSISNPVWYLSDTKWLLTYARTSKFKDYYIFAHYNQYSVFVVTFSEMHHLRQHFKKARTIEHQYGSATVLRTTAWLLLHFINHNIAAMTIPRYTIIAALPPYRYLFIPSLVNFHFIHRHFFSFFWLSTTFTVSLIRNSLNDFQLLQLNRNITPGTMAMRCYEQTLEYVSVWDLCIIWFSHDDVVVWWWHI